MDSSKRGKEEMVERWFGDGNTDKDVKMFLRSDYDGQY